MKIRSKLIFNITTLAALLASLFGSAVFLSPAYAAGAILVNSNADTIADDGVCTLREAITNANGDSQLYATAGECAIGAGSDTITFAADYTITLSGSQLPVVTSTLSINGTGATNTIIQADANPNTVNYRVIKVEAITGTLALSNLTIQNGGCRNSCNIWGGGVLNDGTLMIQNSIFLNNTAAWAGGAVINAGALTITNSTFSGNAAGSNGGAIENQAGTITINRSTFSVNSSSNVAGAIHNWNGLLNVANSTFSANFAASGGGIQNSNGTLNVTNSTFSDNSTSMGGSGIHNYHEIAIPDGIVTLRNTIVANSAFGLNCGGAIVADSFNLDTDGSCDNATQKTSLEVNLGPLADNNGSTQTFALLVGSSAIDMADSAVCASSIGDPNNGAGGFDQRGVSRPQGPGCDIGAFEASTIFTDVSLNYWANSYIERLFNAGVTGGCGTGIYCPDATVTRAQMAVFLLKGIHGSSFTPPAINGSTGFTDVATDYWAAAWIKQLAVEGITGGCGPGIYCPDATVTRAQMAIFLLKAKHGSSYSPPAAAGLFTDVPLDYWAAKWIEQLAAEGITGGCGAGVYCPDNSVTRAQMAVFLVKAFGLP